MAAVLGLTDGTDSVSFLSSTLQLRTGGWNTEASSDDYIWDTFELISDTTDATARTEMVLLNKLIHEARVYANDSSSAKPVWLQWHADGESTKQSLVLDGSVEIISDDIYSPLMGINSIKVSVAIKRMPFWENTSYTTISKTSLSVTGGNSTLTDTTGSLNGRLKAMFVATATAAKNKFWIGIRPAYGGSSDFEPLWECEDGTNAIADTTDVSDGAASGAYKVQTTFATSATLSKRFSITIDDVVGIGDHTDFVGKYQVLCRCKVDASDTQVRVQLRSGFFYLADTDTIVQDTIIDGQSTWQLIELGEIQFPPMGNRDGYADDQLEYAALTIWAERLSVAGSIDFDCFILIPSEHLFTCDGSGMVVGYGPEVYVTPIGDSYAVGNAAGYWGNLDYSLSNWEYPQGGGIIVTAAQDTTHTLTGTMNITLYLIPRWQTYRT